MEDLARRLNDVRQQIADAEHRYHRRPGSVHLVAVSKTQPVEAIRALAALGQRAFGENYVQEALGKIAGTGGLGLEWHFIGAVQSNKCRDIARHFDWVHSIGRSKIAKRLSEQRPSDLPPINVCLQVNLQGESTKAGVAVRELAALAATVAEQPRLRLRGLMAIPAPQADFDAQRRVFAQVRRALEGLNARGLSLDTLSMGMSADLAAAIAEGATVVRIGTALFGPRAKTGRGAAGAGDTSPPARMQAG